MAPQEKGLADKWAARWRSQWFDEIVVNGVRGNWQDPVADVSVDVVHPDYPGWIFTLTLSVHGTVVGFEVKASSDIETRTGHSEAAPPVTARWLRGLPLGAIEEEARRFHTARYAERSVSEIPDLNELVDRHARILATRPRPGRRGRSKRQYAEVAAVYVNLWRSGSSQPVVDAADRLGYTYSQTSNTLAAARRFGLLSSSPLGKFGGDLTPAAIELLNEVKED